MRGQLMWDNKVLPLWVGNEWRWTKMGSWTGEIRAEPDQEWNGVAEGREQKKRIRGKLPAMDYVIFLFARLSSMSASTL